jgi:outer membrane protein assembly factor BamA
MKLNIKNFIIVLGLVFSYSLNISAQDFLEITDILVSGNKRTKTNIILREVSVKIGDTVNVNNLEKVITRSKQNIINTNLFLTVDITQTTDNDEVKLQIIVKERWYILALPIVFLADRSFNEWWYERDRDLKRITYGINAKHFNLTGNNDQLRLKAYTGFIPYYELSYGKPYIDKRQRIGIRFGAFYSTQRTMVYRTWNDKLDFYPSENRMRERKSAFFELRLRNALYHFHTVYIGYTKAKITDSISQLNPNYFGKNITKQNYVSLIYDYRFDKRDNRQYPLKGDLFYTQLSNFLVTSQRKYNQTDLFAFYGKFLSLGKKFYLETNIRAKVSTPKKQNYSLLTGLGFNNNLVRGYELYVIDGQHTAVGKATIKYQLLNRSFDFGNILPIKEFRSIPLAIYPNAFLDFGAVKNYYPELSNSKLSNKLLKGGGVGVDFVTWYNLNLKMYYSINQMAEKKFYFTMYRDL